MNEKNYSQEAKKLFTSKLKKYNENDILEIKLLSGGFTNKCFFIITNDNKKYFVRLGNSKMNRTNEFSYLKASKEIKKYFYYDFDTGNAIKKWNKGHTSTFEECLQERIFEKIIKEIKRIQKIKLRKIPKIKTRDFYCFLSISKLDEKYILKYKEIINKYSELKKVLSHNDIRPSNIIINNSKVKVIDYEWCTLSNKYWDLANISRELDYPIDKLEIIFKKYFKKLDFNIFKEMLFATTCFAVQWTFFEKESDELLKYRKNAIRIMESYYAIL